MRSTTVVQFVLFITSIVIIFAYIKPAYDELLSIQAETGVYVDALESAQTFNTELRKQLSAMNAITTSNTQKLDRYLPKEIDAVGVMRDIEIIATRNNLTLTALAAGEESEISEGASDQMEYFGDEFSEDFENSEFSLESVEPETQPLVSVEFTLALKGAYEDFKILLQDLERNAYPLEVSSLVLTPAGQSESGATTNTGSDDEYTYTLKLKTYKFSNE